MKSLRLGLSIRIKIVLLVAAALAMSLGVYVYVGATLITNDKVSYIYDYSLTDVRAISDRVDTRINGAADLCRTMITILDLSAGSHSKAVVSKLYDSRSPKLGVQQVALFKLAAKGPLTKVLESRASGGAIDALMAEQGWNDAFFRTREFAVGSAIGAAVPIGGVKVSAANEPFVFVAVVDFSDVLNNANGAFETYVVDAKAKALTTNSKRAQVSNDMKALFQELIVGNQESGVREWKAADSRVHIVGYGLVAAGKIGIVSLIEKSEAFAASSLLIRKSVIIGICVLFLTLGFALLFIKGLVRRIRELWHATQRVSEGDFTVRVAVSRGARDEVSSLADSFNTMSGRVVELMGEMVEKMRVDKELETAQVLQSRFFPMSGSNFESRGITVAGTVVPATECSGDWWYYTKVGKYLVVVVGDVTGHGVSAALVTAAVHGAFTILCEQFVRTPHVRPDTRTILMLLNSAVFSAAGGGDHANMTFMASVIDTETGVVMYSNASHRPMRVTRADGTTVQLSGANNLPLGSAIGLTPEAAVFQLLPGDTILWYTDGLIECETPSGRPISKKAIDKTVSTLGQQHNGDAASICNGLVSETIELLGGDSMPRADDITIVIGTVPMTAQFKPSGQEAA